MLLGEGFSGHLDLEIESVKPAGGCSGESSGLRSSNVDSTSGSVACGAGGAFIVVRGGVLLS